MTEKQSANLYQSYEEPPIGRRGLQETLELWALTVITESKLVNSHGLVNPDY